MSAHRFCVRLAGVSVAVSARFASTEKFCADWRADGDTSPAFSVYLTEEDIARERERSAEEDRLAGREPRAFSDPYLETLALCRRAATELPAHGAVLFHGSAVALDGEAYLFTAPSGTGKTTHARLWLSHIPGSFILNGDKPFLSLRPEGVTVHGSPWMGKEGYGRNAALPLRGICLLSRAERNSIRRASPEEVFPELLGQVFRPEESEAMRETLRILHGLLEVPLYRLSCNMEPDAASVALAGMRGAPEGRGSRA